MRNLALALLLAAGSAALAAFSEEPPARTARLAYIEGAVSVHQDPDADWDEGLVNMPLTSGSSVWVDHASRAEVRVSGLALRLAEWSQLDISRLDDDMADATVAAGSASVRVRYKQREERFLVGTPQAAFFLDADGTYRIDFDPQHDESRLTVTSGSAHMESENGDVIVAAGRMLRVLGPSSTSYAIEGAPGADEFDRWAQSRDARWSDVASRRYVSPYMTGFEDLDASGNWSSDPDYGPVWMPSGVAAGWAPYSEGRWVYVQPWGWSWVDSAPWGYAPFHYGRWVLVRGRWAWSPGMRVDRPVYAPALVAWIGGADWHAGASRPAVGWYPLAPWETYHPWYRASGGYADRVNVSVTVRERPPRDWKGNGDEWRNWNRDRATTVVSRDALLQGRAVQQARLQVDAASLRRQPVVAAAQVSSVLPPREEIARTRSVARTPPASAATAPAHRDMAREAQRSQERAVRDAQDQRAAQQRDLQGREPQQRDLRDAISREPDPELRKLANQALVDIQKSP